MITNKPKVNNRPPREGGRPRSFENDDVFRATAAVLARLGYSGLTLDAVAHEVGVTGPAISRRLGSKQALIRAYLEWTIQTSRERFQTCRQRHASAVAALYARYLIPFEERPEELTAFAGWFEMRKVPEFAHLLQERWRLWETDGASLLAEAREAGELRDCDTDELARAITAALAGATLNWSADDELLIARFEAILNTILNPYRVPSDALAQRAPTGACHPLESLDSD